MTNRSQQNRLNIDLQATTSLPPVVECAVGSLAFHLANPCEREDAPMFYEVRTYTLRPGTVAEFEERFAKRLPLREHHSKLGAFWHTEFGPLNQVIHVYPYEDLHQRTAVRAAMAQDTARQQLPGGQDLVVAQEAEIMIPAPFMHPLGSRNYGTGNVYEMRIYTFAPGDITKVLEGWAKAIPDREKFSPLATSRRCWMDGAKPLRRGRSSHPWRPAGRASSAG
jgi:hypothetical protein